MKRARFRYFALLLLVAMAAGGFLVNQSYTDSDLTVSALSEQTHFHGIAVDPTDPSRIYLATHHGLYVVSPDGTARQLSTNKDDFMGFTPHPTDPSILYASGHPSSGGSLGFITSTDGGKSWTRLSDGIDGPVDFHLMDVSKADPRIIYGVYGGLQVSKDGGRTWQMVGPAPEGLIDLAASSKDANILYGATKAGVLKSEDGGRSWRDATLVRRLATMVQTTSDGELYAFVVGTGLIQATEPHLNWRTVSKSVGDAYVLHFAVDPTDDRVKHAVTLRPETRKQGILTSQNGGQTWSAPGNNVN